MKLLCFSSTPSKGCVVKQLIWQDYAGLLFLEHDGTMSITVVLHDAPAPTIPASATRRACRINLCCHSDGSCTVLHGTNNHSNNNSSTRYLVVYLGTILDV